MLTLASLLYATAQGFADALIYEILIGIGLAFLSGARSAWFKEAMYVRGEGERYDGLVLKSEQYRACASLVGGLLGGAIAEWSPRASWLASGTILLGMCWISFYGMDEVSRVKAPHASARAHERAWLSIFQHYLARSWGLLRADAGLIWAVIAAMSLGLTKPFDHYWAPYFQETIGSASKTLLWIPINGATALAAYLMRRLAVGRKHESQRLGMALICASLGLAVIGHVSNLGLSISCIVVHELGRGAFVPLLGNFIQHRITDEYRATYGSLQSLLSRVGYVIVLAAVAWWTAGRTWDNALIAHLWVISGTLLAVIAILLWIMRPNAKSTSARLDERTLSDQHCQE
jgi:hypothetical protein